MGGGKKPKSATPYVPPALIQNRSQERSTQQVLSEQNTADTVGQSSNRSGTILTGSSGLTGSPALAKKMLLGL